MEQTSPNIRELHLFQGIICQPYSNSFGTYNFSRFFGWPCSTKIMKHQLIYGIFRSPETPTWRYLVVLSQDWRSAQGSGAVITFVFKTPAAVASASFGRSSGCGEDMGVSKNSGTPKSSILIGFSIINHPFWGTLSIRVRWKDRVYKKTRSFGTRPGVLYFGDFCKIM